MNRTIIKIFFATFFTLFFFFPLGVSFGGMEIKESCEGDVCYREFCNNGQCEKFRTIKGKTDSVEQENYLKQHERYLKKQELKAEAARKRRLAFSGGKTAFLSKNRDLQIQSIPENQKELYESYEGQHGFDQSKIVNLNETFFETIGRLQAADLMSYNDGFKHGLPKSLLTHKVLSCRYKGKNSKFVSTNYFFWYQETPEEWTQALQNELKKNHPLKELHPAFNIAQSRESCPLVEPGKTISLREVEAFRKKQIELATKETIKKIEQEELKLRFPKLEKCPPLETTFIKGGHKYDQTLYSLYMPCGRDYSRSDIYFMVGMAKRLVLRCKLPEAQSDLVRLTPFIMQHDQESVTGYISNLSNNWAKMMGNTVTANTAFIDGDAAARGLDCQGDDAKKYMNGILHYVYAQDIGNAFIDSGGSADQTTAFGRGCPLTHTKKQCSCMRSVAKSSGINIDNISTVKGAASKIKEENGFLFANLISQCGLVEY